MKKFFLLIFVLVFNFYNNINSCVTFYEPNLFYRYDITTNNISIYSQNYLNRNGYNYYSIPAKLLPEYNVKLENIKSELLVKFDLEHRYSISKYELDTVIERHLISFVDNLKIIVLNCNLEYKVDEQIRNFAQLNNININSLLTSKYSFEYGQKRNNILSDLRRLMASDNRDYVKLSEIDIIVKQDLEYFFNVIKQDNLVYNLVSLIGTGINYFVNTAPVQSSSSVSVITDNNHNIYNYELDTKLLDLIKNKFSRVNIDINNIPARVYVTYEEQYKNLKNKLTDLMNKNYRNYVTKNEAEYYIKECMQKVADEICYYDQICVICQDKYKSGEKLGVLTCGHVYHKDCIYNWLNSDTKKSCPLCRQENIIVEKQETVPSRKVL